MLGILIAVGCSGDGADTISSPGPRGVAFLPENPDVALFNRTVNLLVGVRPVTSGEANGEVTVNAVASEGTLSETRWTQRLGSGDATAYRSLQYTLPNSAVIGSTISVRVFRTTERVAGSPVVDEDILRFTVGSSAIQASLSVNEIDARPGETVAIMMYVGGVGTPEATVNIAGLVSGVVVSPDQVILDEGQQAEEMVGVSYRVPTTATVGSTLLVPVAYRSNAGSGHVPLHIRVVDGSQTRKE